MPSFFDISFTLIEWLAVMGLAQGVLVLVYMFFRVRDWRQAAVPVLYFGLLSAAFALQFAQRLDDYQTTLRLLLWLCWSLGPAVSTVVGGEGGLYLFVRFDTPLSSTRLAERLVQEHGVVTLPGSAFGLDEGCWLRLSFGALAEHSLEKGLERLIAGLEAVLQGERAAGRQHE
jgi:aspartate/methionine/tyrosine aminotransferase